jgi:AraC family transcriptional regulator of adaptative response/methylated-DNA-[protein]-cysteine methyltransferase
MVTSAVEHEILAEDYRRIAQAIAFLDENQEMQPGLSEVAASVGLSEYHLQRLFGRWAGISPKRFLQFLTKEHAKGLLEEARDLLEVTYETGLSSPSRLHELFVTCEAVTPGEYKRRGQGLAIAFGFHPSPFGECLLAVTARGICGLAFVEGGEREALLEALQSRWERADLREEPERTRPLMPQVFAPFQGGEPAPLHLLVRGTNFQLKVWEALLRIPLGRVATYQDVVRAVGLPGAARAVGQAVGSNPIAFLIPCHRVIRQVGVFGGYRWGIARKRAMLAREAALSWQAREKPTQA